MNMKRLIIALAGALLVGSAWAQTATTPLNLKLPPGGVPAASSTAAQPASSSSTATTAKPAPGVLDAIRDADAVLLAPSNPVVSVGTILTVPGVRAALRDTSARIVGVSPIVADRPLRGMADACLTAIGVPTTAEAVGRWYGSRTESENGLLDGWLIHTKDTAEVPGVEVLSVPLLMSSVDATAEMARTALDLAGTPV